MRALGLWVFLVRATPFNWAIWELETGHNIRFYRARRYSCHSLMKMKIGIPNEIGFDMKRPWKETEKGVELATRVERV